MDISMPEIMPEIEERRAICGSNYSKSQMMCIIVIGIADFVNSLCYSILAPFYPAVTSVMRYVSHYKHHSSLTSLYPLQVETPNLCALTNIRANLNIVTIFPANTDFTEQAELKGCSAKEYGLVFGIFELVVFVVSPIYGMYMNKIGAKTVFKIGITITAIMATLFGFLDRLDDHMVFLTSSVIIRILEAIGNAGFLTASFSIIANEFPNKVASMFAALETMFGLGLIVGPTMGGGLYSLGGYTLPFVVLGGLLIVAAIISCIFMPENAADRAAKRADRKPGVTMMAILKITGVQLASLSIISTSLSIGFLQATLEPHLRQFNLTPMVLGLMFVVNGGLYAVSSPIWGIVCDRPNVRAKYITIVGCIFIAAGFLLIGPAPFLNMDTSLTLVIIGLVLHGIGVGAQLVASFADCLKTSIANGLPNSIETYGLVSGLWTSAFALGAFVGPVVSGLLFDAIGFEQSTLFVVALHLILLFVVLIFMWMDRSSVLDVSVSAGDLLQLDGTLDGSVLIGEEYQSLVPRIKSRRRGISMEQSRPPAMNSLIACSSYKNRRSPWSQRTSSYQPAYGSLDSRFRGAVTLT